MPASPIARQDATAQPPTARGIRHLLGALMLSGTAVLAHAGTTAWCGAGPSSGAGTTNLTCPVGQGVIGIGTRSTALPSGPVTAVSVVCGLERIQGGGHSRTRPTGPLVATA